MSNAELIETARYIASARLSSGDSYTAMLLTQLADALERSDCKIENVREIAEPEVGKGYTISAEGILGLLNA